MCKCDAMFSAIQEELPHIMDYITNYAQDEYGCDSRDRSPVSEILRVWRANKTKLFQLLGDEVMVHKQISINAPETEKIDSLNELFNHNQAGDIFKKEFRSKVYDVLPRKCNEIGYTLFCEKVYNVEISPEDQQKINNEEVCLFAYECMDPGILAKNSISSNSNNLGRSITCSSGHKIEIPSTIKPLRFLNKFAKEFNLESFEQFRIAHSQILNDTKLSGQLTLSIHPLDYMTMSDNESNWSSCMSWEDHGDYRQGTVEMMNSPYVLVAYLESKAPMALLGLSRDDYEWNNKKWRCLFIVHDDVISKVKAYPYQNDELENIVLDWITELAEKNLGITYLPEDIPLKSISGHMTGMYNDKMQCNFYFSTYNMYNDFSNGAKAHCRINKEIYDNWVEEEDIYSIVDFDIHYSGPSECMWCGSIDASIPGESSLICNNCYTGYSCCRCGCSINEDDVYVDDCGEAWCPECYNENFITDFVSQSDIYLDDSVQVHLIPKQIWAKLQNLISMEEPDVPDELRGFIHQYEFERYFLEECSIIHSPTHYSNVINFCTKPYYKSYKEASEVNSYLPMVRYYGSVPKMMLDNRGCEIWFYVYDPDDEEFYKTDLCKDMNYSYPGPWYWKDSYIPSVWQENYVQAWNRHIHMGRYLLSNPDFECLLKLPEKE